jgi:UDP-N-acetylmuramyl tripeptide synthase
VLCVLGAGGDRDRGKRAEMGAAAARGADLIVLTSDNPRSEDPQAIIDQLRSGAVGSAEVLVEPDRALAIRRAVGEAGPGDVVMVVGKGHETTQVVGDQVLPFDDRLEAARAVAGRHQGDLPAHDRSPGSGRGGPGR